MDVRNSLRCAIAAAVFGLLCTGNANADPLYTVTDLGVRTPVALNNAGQVALTDSNTVVTTNSYGLANYQPAQQATLYNSYGPQAGQITYVGQALPASGNGIPGVYPPGDWSSGITSSGQVLDGTYLTDGKTAVNLDPGGFIPSSADGVNSNGQFIGTTFDQAAQVTRAVLIGGTQVTDLGSLQGGSTFPNAINNQGQVVGESYMVNLPGSPQQAFLYSDGKMTGLGTLPGGTTSWALGINNLGQVVGGSNGGPTGALQAFLYSSGTMTSLGLLPGSTSTWATAINDRGQVVGTAGFDSPDGSSIRHAVLFQGGPVFDLNSLISPSLHIQLTSAVAINNLGQILVEGNADDIYQSAYLLTPAGLPAPTPPTNLPEPATWAVFALVGVVLVARRRRG